MAEQIVMTLTSKTANSTAFVIERRRQVVEEIANGSEKDVHVAGGDHKGIVINKLLNDNGDGNGEPAHLSLQFKVFLVNAQSGKHVQEQRMLNFWFTDSLAVESQPSVAQEFFRELVSPQEFPRDYIGFITKILKLLQHKYSGIDHVEVELKQIEEPVEFPVRPPSADEATLEDNRVHELTVEKILELIESAYPNPLTIHNLINDHGWDRDAVAEKLSELQKKGLVRAMDNGAFTRVVHQDTKIQVVKQMPTMANSKQPTIAIITAQYCEKLAVDAMIENKETFVRYTTVGSEKEEKNSSSNSNNPTAKDPRVTRQIRFGESNIYTLGDIGAHRIVCTKLPTVGHTREAMTAAGNTTTRLLGTFQKVDYVFLVGVGGGVPHYTDYKRHVRLGDVVISYPAGPNNKFVYTYCESAEMRDDGNYHFETKEYRPTNLGLQDIAANFKKQMKTSDDESPPWHRFLSDGIKNLGSQFEHNFEAPPAESDKLYMNIGDRDVIEVTHPSAPKGDIAYARSDGFPQIHLAPVASGRRIARDDQLRQKFASRFGILAFDAEMDAVVDSILGNCRESFAVVRGIADYKDGSRGKEWQPHAALAAASVVKAMICAMDPPSPVKK
ncbi:PREDICTED: uncharacterized protein LOC105367675 [Ceratosolen solmsi marchali]|uniref:Uncharacterized protein LOC105367675 n=1 Tax=Ceratosolen solmsi marchali TaxID=326594 RepID=A0AAJ7E1U5_9HYME|nr:PREDICTED: uncharacterized protein LOC105367675 [Ceratosolen solmsi marchali]